MKEAYDILYAKAKDRFVHIREAIESRNNVAAFGESYGMSLTSAMGYCEAAACLATVSAEKSRTQVKKSEWWRKASYAEQLRSEIRSIKIQLEIRIMEQE